MNITRKTFYGIGILSAALNILGGAMLLFSIRADLVFNIATVAAGVMMLMLATNLKEDPRGRNFCPGGRASDGAGHGAGYCGHRVCGRVVACVCMAVFQGFRSGKRPA